MGQLLEYSVCMQDNLAKPFRYITAKVQGTTVDAGSPPAGPDVGAASTVVAVPVERAAAGIVRAAFDGLRIPYGPSTIFDLRVEGLEMCDYCSRAVADFLEHDGCVAAVAGQGVRQRVLLVSSHIDINGPLCCAVLEPLYSAS